MKTKSNIIAAYQKDRIYQESKTVTVGRGQDFELLDDALYWASRSIFYAGKPTLELIDGVHTLAGDYAFNKSGLRIVSQSGNAADCTIVPDPNSGFVGMFAYGGDQVYIGNVTYDFTGYSGAGRVADAQSGDVFLENVVIKNVQLISITNMSSYYILGCDISSGVRIIQASYGSMLRISSSTLRDSPLGIRCQTAAKVLLNATTFDNVTTETEYPLNEIQRGGEYISDGTAGLTLAV